MPHALEFGTKMASIEAAEIPQWEPSQRGPDRTTAVKRSTWGIMLIKPGISTKSSSFQQ
jgi:hypothetical protein